jgi:hypothetical protein
MAEHIRGRTHFRPCGRQLVFGDGVSNNHHRRTRAFLVNFPVENKLSRDPLVLGQIYPPTRPMGILLPVARPINS